MCYSIPVGTSHLDNSGCYSRAPHRQFAPWGHVCNMNGKFKRKTKALMSLAFQLLTLQLLFGLGHSTKVGTHIRFLWYPRRNHICAYTRQNPQRGTFCIRHFFIELLKNFSYFHIDLILLHFWLLFDLILLSPLLISKKYKLTLSHWVAGWFDSHPLRSQFLLCRCRPLVPKCRKSHTLLQQPLINRIKITFF